MKNIAKFSYMFLVGMVALLLGACTDSYDYTPAGQPGTEVFFNTDQPTTFEVSKDASSFDISIMRAKAEGELTVPLTFTPGEGNVFTVPQSVTFANGEKEAKISVSYNPADINYGSYSGGTIAVGEGFDTTYGIGSFTFKAGATEWIDMPTNESMGYFRDDAITSLFTFNEGAPVWTVKIKKSAVKEGMYAIVNPYEQWYDEEATAAKQNGEDCAFTYDDSSDHEWIINATDPDMVYLEECHTGMSYVGQDGYGEISLIGTPQYIFNNTRANAQFADYTDDQIWQLVKQQRSQYFGTYKNGVFTFPVNAACVMMEGWQENQYVPSANNGLLAIALPGNEIADYSLEAAYQGRFSDADFNDFAMINLTLGDDVSQVKYALVQSTEDVANTAEGIINGTVESATATASGTVQVAYGESGDYNLVCVIYNAAGDAVGTQSFSYTLKSSKDGADPVETYKEVAAGIYTIGKEDISNIGIWQGGGNGMIVEEATEHEATLLQGESDPTKFRITPYLFSDGSYPLEFTVDADGIITFDELETGLTFEDGTMLLVSDLYTQFLPIAPQLAAQLDENGYRSYYNSDDDVFTFLMNFSYMYNGELRFNGLTEVDLFEVLDRNEASVKKAFAHAKKAAAERKYIYRMPEKSVSLNTTFGKGLAKKSAKRVATFNKNAANSISILK